MRLRLLEMSLEIFLWAAPLLSNLEVDDKVVEVLVVHLVGLVDALLLPPMIHSLVRVARFDANVSQTPEDDCTETKEITIEILYGLDR